MRPRFYSYGKLCQSAIWLLAFALIAQGSSPSLVLCIRADEDSGVEIGCSCHPRQSCDAVLKVVPSYFSSSEPSDLNDSCDPCVDVRCSISTDTPIVPAQDSPSSLRLSETEASTPSKTMFADIVVSIPTVTLPIHRPPPGDSPLDSLRTTVLIC